MKRVTTTTTTTKRMRQTDITEFDTYPHVVRDMAITKAAYTADGPLLKRLLHGLTLDSKIRVYNPHLEWQFRGGNVQRLHFIGNLRGVYSYKTLADFAICELAHDSFVDGFNLLVQALAPQSAIPVLTHVFYCTFRQHNVPILRVLIGCGARYSTLRLSTSVNREHYVALDELVAQRNSQRPNIRIIVGIARFRRRHTAMPWQVIEMIVSMIKLPT